MRFYPPLSCPDSCLWAGQCQINFYRILFALLHRTRLFGLSMHDLWSECLPRTRLSVINGIVVQQRRNGSSSDVAVFFSFFLFFYFSFFNFLLALSTCLPLPLSVSSLSLLSLCLSPASSIEHFCLSKLCLQAENQCPWLDCLWAANFAPGVNWLSNNDPEEGWSLSQGGFVYWWLRVVLDATSTVNLQIWIGWWIGLLFCSHLCHHH